MGVNGAIALGVFEISYGHNLAAANAYVAGIPGRAGTIDDVAVGDDDLEGLASGPYPQRVNRSQKIDADEKFSL
jgi:hypothetical protein